MGAFLISEDTGLVTWSDLMNDSSALCSWTVSVRVSDHGAEIRLWTVASLVVVVDNCRVDGLVHAASRRSAAADPARLLLTDWHIFVVAVAAAACVVVTCAVLTVVVALRLCRRRRRQTKPAAAVPGDGTAAAEGEVMLRLLASGPNAGSSDAGSESTASCSDQLMVMIDPSGLSPAHQHLGHALVHALQHASNLHQLPLQVSSSQTSMGVRSHGLGQLSLASLRGRLIEYQLRLG